MKLVWPTELELLEFFMVGPEKQDTVYYYDVSDSGGVNLIFSFDVMADSVRTELRIKGTEIATVVMEGLSRIRIDNNRRNPYLSAEFHYGTTIVGLDLVILPYIRVRWCGLTDQIAM